MVFSWNVCYVDCCRVDAKMNLIELNKWWAGLPVNEKEQVCKWWYNWKDIDWKY